MWPAVRTIFAEWATQFESRLPYMYLDHHEDKDGNLRPIVTTGIGNALFTVGSALVLPWEHARDRTPASALEIADAYHAVEARTDLALKGGVAFANVTTLRLSDAAIDKLVDSKLTSNELQLRNRFRAIDTWPADAQLGLFSLAWMMGPAFGYPKFSAAANELDFEACAVECFVPNGAPLRNFANEQLFLNAARVLELGLPRDRFVDGVMPITPKKSPIQRPGGGMGGRGAAVILLLASLGGAVYLATRGG